MTILHFIGAGHVAEKLIKKSNSECYLYDNNVDMQGENLHGVLINKVENLSDIDNGEIVICTTSVFEVENQLKDLQVRIPVTVAKEIEEFALHSKILNTRFRFLIASGLPSNNLHGSVGGLYLFCEDGEQNCEVRRIVDGPCHAIIRSGDHYVVASQEQGLVFLDQELNVIKKTEIAKNARIHGVSESASSYVVVCSNLDCLAIIDKHTNYVEYVSFSGKHASIGSPQHHANDVCVIGDYAFVSMFSTSGNWKQGWFDGGLLEVNLVTKELRTISNDLLLPHSVSSIDGCLVVLDSFRGKMFSFSLFPEYSFNGFLRGLDYDKEYLYLSESRNRNSTGLIKETLPASLDSKINIVHRKFNFSRSVKLPDYISEIHSILNI